MEFRCTQAVGKERRQWMGRIEKLRGSCRQCEFEVQSDGSYYHVLIGEHAYGHYVCVPNWDAGCELSDYGDIFWNTERLSKQLNQRDAITIATAIKTIKEML